jgi:hypothetical protein
MYFGQVMREVRRRLTSSSGRIRGSGGGQRLTSYPIQNVLCAGYEGGEEEADQQQREDQRFKRRPEINLYPVDDLSYRFFYTKAFQ